MTRRHLRTTKPWTTTVAALAAVTLLLMPACKGLSDPTSPNLPSDLDGQNTNEFATFDGTITVGNSTLLGLADGITDTFVTAIVQDLAGNPVSNITPVTFFTTMGTVRPVGSDPATASGATQTFVFNGAATVAVRAGFEGQALVTAAIANVAASQAVEFVAPTGDVNVSLVLRGASGDAATLESNAPLDVAVVAKVVGGDNLPEAGQKVRFTITEDTSGGARLASRNSSTDTLGEATTVLTMTGVGRVIVEAEVLDSNDNVAATSNQVIATTRAVTETIAIDLKFADDSTVAAAAAGTTGLIATVTDTRTDSPLVGRLIQFQISSDTAVTTAATLAIKGSSATDSEGKASNAITTFESGSTVVIIAKLVQGGVTIRSNSVVMTVQ